jgi:hypothetical protein|tara:strand:- start:90 stop:323 length:234 start_codon:yes stop_codon:yes gene_type:complete
VVRRTWNRTKRRVFVCGYCVECNKELLNIDGGWIINAEHKHFCDDGKDSSCFNNYIRRKNAIPHKNEGEEKAYDEKK